MNFRNAFLPLSVVMLLTVCCASAQPTTPTLEEKVAKMLVVGFDGTRFDENSQIVKDIRDAKVGGVILFERNITPVEKGENSIEILADMCGKFQALRSNNLMISIDQEGGRVNRLKEKYGFPYFPSAAYLGALDGVDSTRHYAALTAEWLSKLNINTNFTPVVDIIVNVNCPVVAKIERSYSKDARAVAAHATQVVDQHGKTGIFTSLKHFPGHGSSKVDSHYGFTDITYTWSEQELRPFVELMQNPNTSMVMVGHLFNKTIDETHPATMSHKTVTSLLREKLGWEGVVITDDMLMKAIADNYTFEQSVMLTINAGCDMLIFSGNIPKSGKPITTMFVETVSRLVRDGKIDPKMIDDAYLRINKLLNGSEAR